MADVRDILDIDRASGSEVTKEAIVGAEKKKKPFGAPKAAAPKRPEGMAREVFALLYNDKNDAPAIYPTDAGQGYKNMKANLGMKKVRPWKWVPFTNPARSDSAVFHHWRRVCDEGKEYPFARFNKAVQIPVYSDVEYNLHLQDDVWTRLETDHLFDLARRFDLRFVVMADRWDRSRFESKSVEDLKERYYSILSSLSKLKGPRQGLSTEAKNYHFDADHERKRKEQLEKLYSRTKEQVEEEMMLQNELKKIEARKKERERKTQDLQKLISAADNQIEPKKAERKCARKKLPQQSRPKTDSLTGDVVSGIKFPDAKGSGVTLRSQRMKLPANIGQKKTKAIEQLLNEFHIDTSPMPTEEMCRDFNELRSDLLLLHELRGAMTNCQFELQSLRHQYEATDPGKTLVIPKGLLTEPNPPVIVASTSQQMTDLEAAGPSTSQAGSSSMV